jgi:hypothetical protein
MAGHPYASGLPEWPDVYTKYTKLLARIESSIDDE